VIRKHFTVLENALREMSGAITAVPARLFKAVNPELKKTRPKTGS